MKIDRIECAGLRGATPEGGWSNELAPEDCVHTLVAVHADDGRVGIGSVFTSDGLVRGALDVLRPLCRGESAIEPERVSEKLHQHTFWQGRGGAITHAISGIDIALWDLLGQDHGVAFVPHGWNTAVGLAADLQLATAIPNTRFVEYLAGSPFIDDLVVEPWRLDTQGFLRIPDGPGLGIRLDPDAVARHTGSTDWLRP